MKRLLCTAVLVIVQSFALFASSADATRRRPAPVVKTYQVTGPVLEVTNDTIVVQKGKERWEIARDSSTKVTGDLKVGSKVTIQYRMTAASVDAQAPASPKAKTTANKATANKKTS